MCSEELSQLNLTNHISYLSNVHLDSGVIPLAQYLNYVQAPVFVNRLISLSHTALYLCYVPM